MKDRLPPYSNSDEQGVLGCMFLEPNECIPDVIAKFPGAEVFYDLRHQTIYAEMLHAYDSGEGVDIITVQRRLKQADTLEEVGGIVYLSSLPDVVASTANLPTYLDAVMDLYAQRRSIQIMSACIESLYEHNGESKTVLDKMESEIMRLSQIRQAKSEKSIRDYVQEALADIEATFSRQGVLSGIDSGFSDINRLTDGLQPGHMIVIGGRPGTGKSTLFMNIVDHVALSSGLPVGIFSLEMTGSELGKRSIASQAEINLRLIGDGLATQQHLERIARAAGKLSSSQLHIDDRSGLSIMQIRSKARQWVQRFGIKMLGLDYLQLANALGGERKYENRQLEVTEISNGLKTLAKELKIPVIVLSQFNRELEKAQKVRKPKMSDFRESGSVENEADLALLLWTPDDIEDYRDNIDRVLPVNAHVAKNRHGPAGHDIELLFFKEYTKFKPRARVAESDIPQ